MKQFDKAIMKEGVIGLVEYANQVVTIRSVTKSGNYQILTQDNCTYLVGKDEVMPYKNKVDNTQEEG